MDFEKLKKKLITFGEKALETSEKAIGTAGHLAGQALEKTADFTADTIKTSKYCIQSGEDYDVISHDKNLVVFVLSGTEDEKSKAIIWRLPVLLARGWQYSATVRVIFESSLPQVVRVMGVSPVWAGIFREWNLKHALYDETLDAFLDSFDIFYDWNTFVPKSKITDTQQSIGEEKTESTPPAPLSNTNTHPGIESKN